MCTEITLHAQRQCDVPCYLHDETLFDCELLPETFGLYHPIKYQHILISNNL
jgi:hypothetical protein